MGKTIAARKIKWPSARAYLFGAILLFVVLLAPFLKTIFLAAIFAFFFHPYVVNLKRRTGIQKGKFLTVVFSTITALLVGASVFGVSSLFDISKANRQLLMRINGAEFTLPKKITNEIARRFPAEAEQIKGIVNDSLQSLKGFLVSATSEIFASVPVFIMNILVFFVALHFFLTQSTAIRSRIVQMNVMATDQLNFLLRSAHEASRETFISVLVIGLIQTVIVTVAALAVGFEHALPVFFFTFMLSLVPVIGAAPVAFAIGIYMLFQGDTGKGVVMIVAGIITGSIDNVLRSWLMAKSNKIPGGISFVCLIGAIIVFGFYGVFFGPFLGFLAAKFLTRRSNDGTAVA